ncbi:MAG: hypothetical protein HUK15_03390 [Bacteroidales bacterium]|nr:hypothetical protein [Bacteroidales bacterium]
MKNNIIEQVSELLGERPYSCFVEKLYDAESLYEGYVVGDKSSFEKCYDTRVYRHYIDTGKFNTAPEGELMTRVLHDHGVSSLMRAFLKNYTEQQVVGIMGGHGLNRSDESYRRIALLSKKLTEAGALMVSGGGPGAMEATHLGAWLAGRSDEDLNEAFRILSVAEKFTDDLWLDSAFQVMQKFPRGNFESLGIPTWLYGHEPATPFASKIAKLFDNSIREDAVLTVPYGGIVYSPGSAGTLQEIFQDAVQNHYLNFGYASPMIFFGSEFWTKEVPVYSLMQFMLKTGKYKNLRLHLTDNPDEVVDIWKDFCKLF